MDLLNQLQAEVKSLSQQDPVRAKDLMRTTCLNFLSNIATSTVEEEEAMKYVKALITIANDNDWAALSNCAHVLNTFTHYEEALDLSKKAIIATAFNEVAPLFNHAVILMNCLRVTEAIEAYKMVEKLTPNDNRLKHNLSCSLLINGQFEEGWQEYEHRMGASDKIIKFQKRFTQPRWDGSDIGDKKLCVYSEQGVGDLLQFCRFLPLIQEKTKNIVFEVQQECKSLLESSFPEIEFVGRNGGDVNGDGFSEPPKADYCFSICSVPYLFKLNTEQDIIKFNKPYIKTNKKIPFNLDTDKKRIGICWAGNPTHGYDHFRSCQLEYFRKVSELPDVLIFGLQKENHMRYWNGRNINLNEVFGSLKMVDLSSYLDNFEDTAAWINTMDLVITIDSAIAHLAGSMSKPVWTIIPYVPDWRWQLKRSDNPWYPSMKLFRHKSVYSWSEVFDRIEKELQVI